MGFEISHDLIREGLKYVSRNTGLQGRWQVLGDNPKVICDTAHNREGLLLVMSQLEKEIFENLHIVLGVVNDKDLGNILSLMPKKASYYFCKPDIPRGLSAELLKEEALKHQLYGDIFESVDAAYQDALEKAGPNDLIFIGGSTFVVAELDL